MRLPDAIVTGIGAAVALAWVFHVEWILDLTGPSRMVLPTALGFVFSGILVSALKVRPASAVRLATNALALLGVLITTTFSALFSQYSGLYTVAVGMPSIGALAAFHLIAVCGVLRALRENHHRSIALMLGSVALIGAVAMAGWIIDVPALYFFAPGRSTGMSPITASCFLMLGLGYFTREDRP